MEIKEIIKEEIQSFNERQPVFRFTDIVENPTFLNFQAYSNDYDVDIKESDISVVWRVGFWLNDNGIENFMIDAQEVLGTYKVELRDKQSDELAQENDRNIAEIPWKFNIVDAPLIKGQSFYIDNVSFDFETKICTVSFNPQEQELNEMFGWSQKEKDGKALQQKVEQAKQEVMKSRIGGSAFAQPGANASPNDVKSLMQARLNLLKNDLPTVVELQPDLFDPQGYANAVFETQGGQKIYGYVLQNWNWVRDADGITRKDSGKEKLIQRLDSLIK